jgi:putative Holliday junction resolvase
MRVLGIDMGLKRTGLAVSDETGTAIRHLPNLLAHSRTLALEKVLSLVKELSIKAVVIGKPEVRTDGSKAISMRAEGFKSALEEAFKAEGLQVEVYLLNEEYTSKKAMANLIEAGVPQKSRALMLDSASAAVLVEDFLKAKKTL